MMDSIAFLDARLRETISMRNQRLTILPEEVRRRTMSRINIAISPNQITKSQMELKTKNSDKIHKCALFSKATMATCATYQASKHHLKKN